MEHDFHQYEDLLATYKSWLVDFLKLRNLSLIIWKRSQQNIMNFYLHTKTKSRHFESICKILCTSSIKTMFSTCNFSIFINWFFPTCESKARLALARFADASLSRLLLPLGLWRYMSPLTETNTPITRTSDKVQLLILSPMSLQYVIVFKIFYLERHHIRR